MADQQQLEILKRGVTDWNNWRRQPSSLIIDMSRAELPRHNFTKANLCNANFQDASLYGSVFLGADLSNADFRNADLRNVDFRGANLSHADLSSATGLKTELLASADLTHAQLPTTLNLEAKIAAITDLTKEAGKLSLSLLVVAAYSWITLGATTDAALITDSATIPLPIVGTTIPITWFYWVCPALLLTLYLNFHFYLQRLWIELASMPAFFPDGVNIYRKVYPWPLNSLACAYSENQSSREIAKFERPLAYLVGWWFIPFTLMFFWVRYLRCRDWECTIYYVLVVVLASVGALVSLKVTAHKFKCLPLDNTQRSEHNKEHAKSFTRSIFRSSLALFSLLLFISFFSFNGVPAYLYAKLDDQDHRIAPPIHPWNPYRLVPYMLDSCRASVFVNLDHKDVASPPAGWNSQSNDIKQVKPVQLTEKWFPYAVAGNAFLVNADMRRAHLNGADFWQADLRGAQLKEADLTNTYCLYSDFRQAQLPLAHLEDSDFSYAHFEGANLISAYLDRANFTQANLTGATLLKSTLTNTNLQNAILQGAHLEYATFEPKTIRQAHCWKLAHYGLKREIDEKEEVFAQRNAVFLKGLGLPPRHNDNIDIKSLKNYDFRGLSLVHADLREYDLTGARFEGADLRQADLRNTNITWQQLNNKATKLDGETKLPLAVEKQRKKAWQTQSLSSR